MKLAAVIASRGGDSAKTRFSGHLSSTDRDLLTQALLATMLCRLKDTGICLFVVSPTLHLLDLAERFGAQSIPQVYDTGLNAGFASARDAVLRRHPEATIALLPGDLPLISASDLRNILMTARSSSAMIVRSATASGTGALVLPASSSLRPEFGTDSFRRHMRQAFQKKERLAPAVSMSIARDADTPVQLAAMQPELLDGELPSWLRQTFDQLISKLNLAEGIS